MLKAKAGDIVGATPDRIYTFPELRQSFGVPYTRQHLSRLEADGSFPKRIQIGARIGWLGSELAAWQRRLIAERDRGTEAAAA